ncbi:hypothetical protein Vadar_009887 [Vaccinium darrowii]|uniref:Uncharacterized protein n=1 Tax=Vaccinium darrowii TaxID=229202 RepID=A0ACB7YWE2_9ERIC|nr:hypothetical protein Vadar_009887 [Vaccinium darrowii]
MMLVPFDTGMTRWGGGHYAQLGWAPSVHWENSSLIGCNHGTSFRGFRELVDSPNMWNRDDRRKCEIFDRIRFRNVKCVNGQENVWRNCGYVDPEAIRKVVSAISGLMSSFLVIAINMTQHLASISHHCWAIWKLRDECVFIGYKSAAFSVILRDFGGSVVEVNYGRIKVSSALAAEAWAIRVACSMARSWEKREAIIESDCGNLIQMLSLPSAMHWSIIEDIILMNEEMEISFVWCKRTANMCANWFATMCRSSVIILVNPCNLPGELFSLMNLDKDGFSLSVFDAQTTDIY